MFSNHPTVRVVIYGLAIAAQIVAVFIRVTNPDLAAAFDAAAGILAGAAGLTALTNITPTPALYTEEDAQGHIDG